MSHFIQHPEDLDALLVYRSQLSPEKASQVDAALESLKRTHPIVRNADWAGAEPLAYAMEKETRSPAISQIYRHHTYSERAWAERDSVRRYEDLISAPAEYIVRRNDSFGFLGPLKRESNGVAEIAHDRFTLHRDQLRKQIQVVETLLRERRGFHVHISFPARLIDNVPTFFVWHHFASLYLVLKQAEVGLVGDTMTSLPSARLIDDAMKTEVVTDMGNFKFGSIGFRNKYLTGSSQPSGISKYFEYGEPRVGLELRDTASGTQEILGQVDWLSQSLLRKIWEMWNDLEPRQLTLHWPQKLELRDPLPTGASQLAIFLREYGIDSLYLWPLTGLESGLFPVLKGAKVELGPLDPVTQGRLQRARALYMLELEKTQKSLAEFLQKNPDTPEHEVNELVDFAVRGDFANWAREAKLSLVYGAALGAD